MFMLFMEAAACALSTGFAMLLIFIDSQDRPAEMNRDQEQTQRRTPDGGITPVGVGEEVPLRLLAEIDAEKGKVDIHQAVDLPCECGLHLVPMGVGDLGERYLDVAVCLLRDDIPALLDEEVLQGVNDLLRDEHHPRQRTADDAVKCDKDGERDQGPEAAGHGVDALFAVQLLHFGIELLGVALVPLLKLLDPGAAGAWNASCSSCSSP